VSKNKDPHYVVKIEKAIAEKYGHEAIQNPKSNWDDKKEKEYLEQIKKLAKKENKIREKTEKVDAGGFFINRKLLIKKVERTCSSCDVYSFSKQDDVYIAKYNCCYKCYVNYVEHREEKWLSSQSSNKGEK